jgi:hypothetical protein
MEPPSKGVLNNEESNAQASSAATQEVPIESLSATTAADVDSNLIDNDIMAEFERAVAEQKAATAAAKSIKADAKAEKLGEKKLQAVPTPESVTEPVTESVVPLAAVTAPVDLAETEVSSKEADINIDKMLNEAQELTTSDENQEVLNSIDSTLDTDKLLKEATGMGNIDSAALTEFSDFVKKEGA